MAADLDPDRIDPAGSDPAETGPAAAAPAPPSAEREAASNPGAEGFRPSTLLAAGFTALALAALSLFVAVARGVLPLDWTVAGDYVEPRDWSFDTVCVALGWVSGICAVIGLMALAVGFYRLARQVEPPRRG